MTMPFGIAFGVCFAFGLGFAAAGGSPKPAFFSRLRPRIERTLAMNAVAPFVSAARTSAT
jgi:hypothetical protein